MASIVLASVGRAVGTAVGGPLGGQIGAVAGNFIGGGLERGDSKHYEGARLEELSIQSSVYGRMIPLMFGAVRVAGNVIWSLPIKELETTTTTRSGGKGGSRKKASAITTTTQYSYFVTLAIAIGEGPITRINRVWADAKLLDLSQGTYRIYKGDETQLPDPLIESFEGVGKVPAYRGMAYVVIEDFPIGDFGNRVPNFTFEVTRQAPQRDNAIEPVENMVSSIMLIPGSGEFVYDTDAQFKITGQDVSGNLVQQGYRVPLNQHTADGKANMLVALDQLEQTFPNLEWVGVAVNWFGSSMDIATCDIKPRVEYQANTQTTPDDWSVAGLTRSTATLVGTQDGVARYGGTPDDGSIVRLCTELRNRGYKIFFYPMMLMDVDGKPWRGYLSGAHGQVSSFFSKTHGYNHFILHYANLVAGKVDAFAIGTEMRDLTKITSSTGVFPAVTQFIALAASVRAVLGSGVKLTYAADWSEYHHTDGGWYHLDPLWADSNIDMVGIDAYFPLTNAVQTDYDIQTIRDGWTSGEGYDFYYTDEDRTTTAPLGAAYAWKNIAWWWNNAHVNPNSVTTAWVPQSKPIWFTEYGFASVDGCANQPNLFIDASSDESGYPRFSRGRVDFLAQRAAITATETEWAGSSMVVNKFLWTWDARPYPYWPDLRSVWADGANWVTGHWVQGKLGASHVAAVVEQIAQRAGLDDAQIDTAQLQMMLEGFVVHERTTARAILSQLGQAYFFQLIEREGALLAKPQHSAELVEVVADACVPLRMDGRELTYVLTRDDDLSLPEKIEVQYLNRLRRYETHVQAAARATQEASGTRMQRFSLVLSETHARAVAEQLLGDAWAQRSRVQLQLPMRFAGLEPGDRLALTDGSRTHRLRVEQVQFGRPGLLRVRAYSDEADGWDGYIAPLTEAGGELLLPPAPTQLEILDMPAFPSDAPDALTLRFAACGVSDGWTGASIVRELSTGDDEVLLDVNAPATIGRCTNTLASGTVHRFDKTNLLDVLLIGDRSLVSTSDLGLLNGANVALVGNEVIQFGTAEALGEGNYRLSNLLRGRMGTESAVGTHAANERFVLLDGAIGSLVLPASFQGQTWHLRGATFGTSLAEGTEAQHTLLARSLRPLSPVHLKAVKDGSGDITLSWVRRARIDGAWRDAVDIPLMETTEQYDVTLYNGSTALRTVRVTSAGYLYSLAAQTADFGGAQTTVKFGVCQLSALAGAGEQTTEIVTVQ